MNKEELLEEAKRRYPIGTNVICLFGLDTNRIESHECEFDEDGDLWMNCDDINVMVYSQEDDEWADISSDISRSNKYTKEDVIEFKDWCDSNFAAEWAEVFDDLVAINKCEYRHKTTTELFDLWVKSKEGTK